MSILLVFVLTLGFAGNVFAAESANSNSSQITKISLPPLDSMQTLAPGQKLNMNTADRFYKINVKGETYVLESTFVKDSVATTSSVSPTAVASSSSYSQAQSVYSNVGILLGTLTMHQSWEYNNGTYTYLPNPTLTPYVPWYAWPNYFSNLLLGTPIYNSSTREYTSATQGNLNNTTGPYTFQTFTLFLSITFDAYGHAYGSSYYW